MQRSEHNSVQTVAQCVNLDTRIKSVAVLRQSQTIPELIGSAGRLWVLRVLGQLVRLDAAEAERAGRLIDGSKGFYLELMRLVSLSPDLGEGWRAALSCGGASLSEWGRRVTVLGLVWNGADPAQVIEAAVSCGFITPTQGKG